MADRVTAMDSVARPIFGGDEQDEVKARRPTLDDLNLPRRKKVISTFFGKIKAPNRITIWEWLYLFVSLASLVASFGVSIERFISIKGTTSNVTCDQAMTGAESKEMEKRADLTFAILVMWTSLCSVYHVVMGVLSERPYDIAVYMVTTIAVWIYAVVNYVTAYEARTEIKLIRLIVISIVGPVIIAFSIYLVIKYRTSKLVISAIVGNARPDIQAMADRIFQFVSLVQFDVQLGGSAAILWYQRSLVEENMLVGEIIVSTICVTITIVWGLIAILAIRLENHILVWILFISSPIEPGFFIFNIVRTKLSDHPDCFVPVLFASMIACGVIALGSRIATIWVLALVKRDFGKGLKERIFGSGDNNQQIETIQRPPPLLKRQSTPPN